MSTTSEQALLAARQRGAVDEELLAVLRRDLLACGVEEVEGASRLAVREVAGGRSVLVWTRPERARAAGWPGDVVEVPGSEIAELVVGSGLGIALNPGEQDGVGLDPDGVQALAAVTLVPAGTAVYLGEPAEPQTALEERLLEVLPSVPQVLAARTAQVFYEGDEVPAHPMVVLTLDSAAGDTGRASALQAVGPATAGGQLPVDVVVDTDLGALQDTAATLLPFYER